MSQRIILPLGTDFSTATAEYRQWIREANSIFGNTPGIAITAPGGLPGGINSSPQAPNPPQGTVINEIERIIGTGAQSAVTGRVQSLGEVISGGALGSQGVGVSPITEDDLIVNASPPNISSLPFDEDTIQIIQDVDSDENKNKPEIILISDFKPFYKKNYNSQGEILTETSTKKSFDDTLEYRVLKSLKFLTFLNSSDKDLIERKRLNSLSVAKFFHENFINVFSLIKKTEELKDLINPYKNDIDVTNLYYELFESLSETDVSENIKDEKITARKILEFLNLRYSRDASIEEKEFSNTKVLTHLKMTLSDLVTTQPRDSQPILQNLRISGGERDFSYDKITLGSNIEEKINLRPGQLDSRHRFNFFNKDFSIDTSNIEYALPLTFKKRKEEGKEFDAVQDIKNLLKFFGISQCKEIIDYNDVSGILSFLSQEISISLSGRDGIGYNPNNYFDGDVDLLGDLRNNNVFYTLVGMGSDAQLKNTLFGSLRAGKTNFFEENTINLNDGSKIKSFYQDFLKSVNSLSFEDEINSFSSLLEGDNLILKDLKNKGFIPVFDSNRDFPEVFTSNKFFQNIYYRFFTENHSARFTASEEFDPMFKTHDVFSDMLNIFVLSGDDVVPLFNPDSENRKFLLKYGIFELIWNLCDKPDKALGTFDEIYADLDRRFRDCIRDVEETSYNKAPDYSKKLKGDSSVDTGWNNPLSLDFFNKNNGFSEELNKKSLFILIFSTLKEFYSLLKNNIVDIDGLSFYRKLNTKQMMLLLYEAILALTVPAFVSYPAEEFRKENAIRGNISSFRLIYYGLINGDQQASLNTRIGEIETAIDNLEIEKAWYRSQSSNQQYVVQRIINDLKQEKLRIEAQINIFKSAASKDLTRSARIDKFNTINAETSKIDSLTRDIFLYLYGFNKNLLKYLSEISVLKEETKRFILKTSELIGDVNYTSKVLSKDHVFQTILKLEEIIKVFENKTVFNQGNSPNVGFLNSSLLGERTKAQFLNFMKLNTDENSLKDSKLISIGIPSGFKSSNTSFNERNLDSPPGQILENRYLIIGVGIVNLLYPDVVFQKKYFKFDLDKFLIREDDKVVLNSSNVLKSIPLSSISSENFSLNFSSLDEAASVENLVKSYFIEIYLKSLSNISLSEGSVFERKFFNSSAFDFSKIRDVITIDFISEIQNNTTPVNTSITPYSSYEKIALNLVFPKRFDRIFNVVVNRKDFFVDPNKTDRATENSLIRKGVLSYYVEDSQSYPRVVFSDKSIFDYCMMYSTIEFSKE